MVELTLLTLLNSMAGDFCRLRSNGMDMLPAVLTSYSLANDRFGGKNVRRVVNINETLLGATAVTVVTTKCPQHL
jgi:hypothetical protein